MKPCPICNAPESIDERVLNAVTLLRCKACSFVYADVSAVDVETVNSSYGDNLTEMFEQEQTRIDRLWFKKIAQRFSRKMGTGTVLDVGCGNGLLLKCFHEAGWTCFGVDLSPWAQKPAQEYGFDFYQGKIEELGLPDSKYDLVLSASTLEHISEPRPHVAELLRVVKPGGRIYFSGIPNYASASIRMGLSDFYSNKPPAHVNYFTCKSLSFLLGSLSVKPANFSVRTYGIPEAQKLYRHITPLLKKKSGGTHREASAPGAGTVVKPSRKMKDALSAIAISIYLTGGRPFSAGSKIEAELMK